MSRKLTKVVALIVVNLVLIAVGFEFYFRYIYDTTDILNYGLSSQRWNRRYVQLNSFGFRDEEYRGELLNGNEKPITIFFMGDSFTFGLGIKHVQDRYPNLVCDVLKRKLGNVRCYNLAYHGWDLGNYVDALEEYMTKIGSPDVVIFQYFMNDIEIYNRLRFETDEFSTSDRDSFMGYVHSDPLNPALEFLYWKSYAFNFFYLRYRLLSSVKGITYEEVLQNDYADEKKYQLVENQLARITQLNQLSSAQTGFIIFPLMDANRKTYRLIGAHNKLHASLSNQGFSWFDLTSDYWQYTPKQLIVNTFDAHPNEKANKIAASKVLDLISVLLEKQATKSTAKRFEAINSCQSFQLN